MNKILNVFIVLMLSLLTISCSSIKKASGPAFQDDQLTNNDVGRIIIYQPLIPAANRVLSDASVSINNVETSALLYGGYHLYELNPGLHILHVRRSSDVNDYIVVNIKANETVYFKLAKQKQEKRTNFKYLMTKGLYNFNEINQIERSVAIPELMNAKLEYATTLPIDPMDFNGATIMAPRNRFLKFENINAQNKFDIFMDPLTAVVVPSGLNTFDVSMSYSHSYGLMKKAISKTSINAKNNCIYLFNFTTEGDYVSFYKDEYCQNSIN